jgi:hypothetical protein
VCTRWDVEYVPVEFVECGCSVDVLDVYCVEIVECVPSGSVDYGYLVEMLRWVPGGGNVKFALIGMLSMHQVAVWNKSTKWGC